MKDFDKIPKSTETPIDRAKRIIAKRPKNIHNQISTKFSLPLEITKYKSGPPDPPPVPFKHINAGEQIRGSSGGGSSGLYFKDLFTVTDPSNKEFNLSFKPTSNSEIVSWNGQVLSPGVSNDYIVVVNPTNQVQLSGYIVLHIGDIITVSYTYIS